MNRNGFILSTYVYMLLVFFLLLLVTMLAVLNNTKLLSNKLKEQVQNSSGLLDKEFSFVLLGNKNMVIRKDEEYVEPLYIAKTSKGKDIKDNVKVIGDLDTSVPNSYKLTYKLTYNGVTKKLERNIHVIDNIASTYIEGLYQYKNGENSLINPKVTYNSVEYDTGIRYEGVNPNNYVYYNCEDKDSNNISYGEEDYDYATSCEVWRIIGAFDVQDGNRNTQKRVKIINTNSIFTASWDSSATNINSGDGINQWGESTYANTTKYEGSDLMQLLNGYYVSASGSECKYNNTSGQSGLSQTCTAADLKSAKMKKLTTNALSMIDNTLWYVYATDTSKNSSAYLQERGITKKYTGCLNTELITTSACSKDSVTRSNEWVGLVGLMSVSDIGYAKDWLYNNYSKLWSITPLADSANSNLVWISDLTSINQSSLSSANTVLPSVYLKQSIKITAGDGTEINPYKLGL